MAYSSKTDKGILYLGTPHTPLLVFSNPIQSAEEANTRHLISAIGVIFLANGQRQGCHRQGRCSHSGYDGVPGGQAMAFMVSNRRAATLPRRSPVYMRGGMGHGAWGMGHGAWGMQSRVLRILVPKIRHEKWIGTTKWQVLIEDS